MTVSIIVTPSATGVSDGWRCSEVTARVSQTGERATPDVPRRGGVSVPRGTVSAETKEEPW
jgi:hypothetical protein